MEHITLEELRELLREAELLKSKMSKTLRKQFNNESTLDDIIYYLEEELKAREKKTLDMIAWSMVR